MGLSARTQLTASALPQGKLMAIIQAIRTALFYAIYFGQTAIIAILIGLISVIRGRSKLAWKLAVYWCTSNITYLRLLTGVKSDVTGYENIPEGGCIIASKHQSDWDVFAIFPHVGRPAYIVKQELMDIPVFGTAARAMDCIAVNRKQGGNALPIMMREAKAALERGCRIVIFPEGTRRAPLAPAQYRQGIVRMYTELKVPVVPVALNAGLFWGRNSATIWPGTARARFLPAIEPGLPPEEFLKRLTGAIEPESEKLTLDAIEQGLGRPVPPQLAARAAELRAASETSA
jgi:1-acyl-sn-glycerol-3-phosphate acyltransferase